MVIEKVCIISRNVPREAFTVHWAWQDCGVCLTLQIKDTMKPVEISLRSQVTHFSKYVVSLYDNINQWTYYFKKGKSITLMLPVMQLSNSRLNWSPIFSQILDKKVSYERETVSVTGISNQVWTVQNSICKILPWQHDNMTTWKLQKLR